MNPTSRVGGRGFALAELGAVIAIVAVTVVVACVMMRRERAAMWDAVDAENLQRFAAATTEYAADNGDKYWTFSWRRGMDFPTNYADLKTQNYDDRAAGAAQAVDILRRKAGRGDVPVILSWLAHPFYSHLALYDYMNDSMPALWGVCPANRHRLSWAKDPFGFDHGEFLPCQPTPGPTAKRWPYSSSYELSTSFYDQSATNNRISQAGGDNLYYTYGETDLYGKLLGDTAFPSQKMHLFETDRHHLDEGGGAECDKSTRFYLPDTRTAMLFADGHCAWMKTSGANPGWQPNNPTSPDPTYFQNGEGDYYPGVYRWTREFIGGRDFGGPEPGMP